MSELKVMEPTCEELVEEAVNEMGVSVALCGLEDTDEAQALVRDVVARTVGSGLERSQAALALQSATNTVATAPDARARRSLRKALEADACEDEEALSEVEANRRKAAVVTEAARYVARHCLDDGQRVALGELLRLGCKLRGSGVDPMQLDVVCLFEAAFGQCSKGYAWVKNAELDLAAELLDELERSDGDRAPSPA